MADPDPTAFPALLMQMMEGIKPVIEAVAGYRESCEAAGFSQSAAEQMAFTVHGQIIAVVFAAMAQQANTGKPST